MTIAATVSFGRRQILDGARVCFARYGYEGATVALKAGQASGVDLEIIRGTLSAAFVGP